MHDVLWGVGDPISRWMAPDLNTNHWNPDIETLKMHYREKLPLIKDRSWDPWVSGWVLWGQGLIPGHPDLRGPIIPAPVVITSLFLALYSLLTMYCVLPCMIVMHDVLGVHCRSHIPLSTWPGPLTQTQTVGSQTLKR